MLSDMSFLDSKVAAESMAWSKRQQVPNGDRDAGFLPFLVNL
jgi:hypothetical protein